MDERHVREEMRNILKNQPVWPGDVISHATAHECEIRGWAVRTVHGNIVATDAGREAIEAREGGQDGM